MNTCALRPNFPSALRRGFVAIIVLCAWWSCLNARAQPIVLTNLFSLTNSTNNGTQPMASLVLGTAGTLYGTTFTGGMSNAGAVFKINLSGSGYTLIHSFSFDDTGDNSSFNPATTANTLPIVLGTDRMIYGTSIVGGTNGDGMVYKMFPDGSGYTVLHSFGVADGGPRALILGNDGALYGVGVALFRLTTDGNTYQVLHTLKTSSDGIEPFGLMQASNGMLYGTTFTAGTNSSGCVFKATTDGSNFSTLRSFPAAANDPKAPTGLIQGSDGFLYGTSYGGGTNQEGAIFKMATDGSAFQVLYSFTGAPDGVQPFGTVLQSGNFLYGTTRAGGAGTGGTIFKIDLTGNGYGILYNFPNAVFGTPFAGLTQGPAEGDTGVLYGAAANTIGDPHDGAIFAMLLNPPASITPLTGPAANGQKAIFWPAWAAGYVLQTTTNLSSGTWVT